MQRNGLLTAVKLELARFCYSIPVPWSGPNRANCRKVAETVAGGRRGKGLQGGVLPGSPAPRRNAHRPCGHEAVPDAAASRHRPADTLSSILRQAGLSRKDLMKKYAVIIEKGPTNFGAYVPDLPGCVAVADTVDKVEKLTARPSTFTSRECARMEIRYLSPPRLQPTLTRRQPEAGLGRKQRFPIHPPSRPLNPR